MSKTPMDLSRPLTRPALAALAALALAGAVRAQEAPADERAVARDRVLTLTSGELVRGRARWVADAASPNGGHWELREDGGWRALREGSVAQSRDARELLREADRLAREVRVGEHDRRAALAQWMVSHGLAEEATLQLDRVLRAEPDHDGALNVIARGGFPPLEVVDERRDPVAAREMLIHEGMSSSPTHRELAIRALGALEDQDGVREALLRELTVFRHQQRAFATQAMRRLMPGEELRPLLARAALDRSGVVRLGASLALRASGEEAVILPLVRAFDSESVKVRMNAAESLGHIGFEAAVPALVSRMATLAQSSSSYRPPAANIAITNQVAYVSDYDVEIAQGASIADPQVNVVTEGVILDGRAYGFQEYSVVDEIVTVRRSLKQLTGHDAGRDPEKWLEWYEEHRSRYEGGGETE
jgi:hypothetical protein